MPCWGAEINRRPSASTSATTTDLVLRRAIEPGRWPTSSPAAGLCVPGPRSGRTAHERRRANVGELAQVVDVAEGMLAARVRPMGLPAVVDAHPRKPGKIPIA